VTTRTADSERGTGRGGWGDGGGGGGGGGGGLGRFDSLRPFTYPLLVHPVLLVPSA